MKSRATNPDTRRRSPHSKASHHQRYTDHRGIHTDLNFRYRVAFFEHSNEAIRLRQCQHFSDLTCAPAALTCPPPAVPV